VSDLAALKDIPTKETPVGVHYLERVDSTHQEARRLLSTNPALPFVVLAEEQISGRGRIGRHWHSDPGLGIWMTVAIARSRPIEEQFTYTFIASLAVAVAIEEITGLRAKLKWPNDVLLGGKKCCGILLESLPAVTLIGIGLNVNHTTFPDEIQNSATSLRLESGRKWSRVAIVTRCVQQVFDLTHMTFDMIIDRWKRRAGFLGSTVVVQLGEETFEGKAVDVASDGGLIIETEMARRTIHAGEVRVRLA